MQFSEDPMSEKVITMVSEN